MHDQSFSYNNLKEIYDIEKRKGHSLDNLFTLKDQIAISNSEIKSIYKEIKAINVKFNKKITEIQRKKLNLKKDKLEVKLANSKEYKNNLLKKEIESISDEINDPTFSVLIEKKNNFLDRNKPFYSIQDNLKGFLFKKHIQRQLNRLYKIKQSNRYLIVSQVYEILNHNKTSLFNVIKIDIKSFYESVKLPYLENKLLIDDNLLSPRIKKHITSIISQYKKLSGSDNGIPRGIGISAYLGELYLRNFDSFLRKNNDIYYYSRYVDDIIIITAKDSHFNIASVVDALSKIGLSINKSKYFNLRDNACVQDSFDYLGYCFTFLNRNKSNEKLNIDMSEKRFERYKEKIDIAFNSYQKTITYGRKSSKYLLLRIKFLVSNLRLTGDKKNIVSGIYYSNKLVHSPSFKINNLDLYLNSKKKSVKSVSLRAELKKMSFKSGFDKKDENFFFLKRNIIGDNKESKELQRLLRIWKYVK